MTKRLVRMMVVALAVMVLAMPAAYAIPTLQLADLIGGISITIQDGSPGDMNSLPGVITYVGPVGANWYLNVTTGQINQPFGTPTVPHLDVNSVDNSLGAGTLQIMWSEVGFGPLPAGVNFQGNIGGTTTGNVTYSAFYDPANVIFGTPAAGKLFQIGPLPGVAFSGMANSIIAGPIAAPYSLTQVIAIGHPGVGTTSFNASLDVVPEPSALLLVGTGLAAIGAWRIRKR